MNIPDFIPVLGRGNHASPESGACVMEMVSFIAGENWTDMPECVQHDIARLAQQVNDFVSDDNRNKIAHMIPRFIGTDKLTPAISEFGQKRAEALKKAFADYKFITNETFPHLILIDIKDHFRNETDINKRLTNEEYDDLAMKILEVTLDVADQVLERGVYAIETEEAFAKIAELPCQKVHS
jgi:hypothetical protein